MDLQQLTTFRTIATLGSFSHAAEIMGYAQSTVSEQIKNLENELGTRLFRRAGSKRVDITPAGKTLLEYSQKMLNLEEEIRSEVNQPAELHGTLTIRIPETISIHYLPEIVARFHRSFPKINLTFMNCTYFDLAEELKAGIADLGYLITDLYNTSDLVTEVLCPIPLLMVTHPHHPLAADIPIDFSKLRGEPLIVPANDCSYVQMLERVLTEQKVKLNHVWRFNSLEAIINTLVNGTGVSVLPEIAVRDELNNGRLTILPWQAERQITVHLMMIWLKNKWLPPALENFMQMVREALAV